jgi:outer membrane protein
MTIHRLSGRARGRAWIAAFLLVLLAGGASKALAENGAALTLNQAIAIALKNNPGLKQTANQVVSGKISVSRNRANFLPDLQLNAQGAEQIDKQKLPQDGHTYQTVTTSISSTLNLFNGFGDIAALAGSKLDLQARMDSFTRAQQSLVYTTASEFLTVASDRELIRVQDENLQSNRRQLEQIQSFFKAGTRPISDVYQQQAATSSSELSLLQAQRTLRVDKLKLLQALGLAAGTPFSIVVPTEAHLVAASGKNDLSSLTDNALKHRPDLRAQRKQIAIDTQAIHQAKAGYWPTLNLVAGAGSDFSNQLGGDGFSRQFFTDNPNASVGLSLSIPLFDRDLTRSNVAQARVQQQNDRLALDQLHLQVSTEIGQALQDYRTAQKQVQVTGAQLRYARQALNAVQARYRVGAATLVDLLQARTQYVQASSDRVNARYSLMNQALNLAYTEGNWSRMNTILSLLEPKQ